MAGARRSGVSSSWAMPRRQHANSKPATASTSMRIRIMMVSLGANARLCLR